MNNAAPVLTSSEMKNVMKKQNGSDEIEYCETSHKGEIRHLKNKAPPTAAFFEPPRRSGTRFRKGRWNEKEPESSRRSSTMAAV
ncbi:hypothetical protein TNCV_2505511 [Trichonephila clavipes]|uniref:Uncharacterized protein n=1 Tax=Trichonephila clavipes TaxID=2585209 RepID=A0A8X7BK76_TRICX|nr:hypothetical protein TNCV_2505511 [Trichonephila clavipes]